MASNLDEFELIERYFAPLASGEPGAFGLTDDAAELEVRNQMGLPPVTRMAQIADEVSTGKAGAPLFELKGDDEIATLSVSFNRMRRSLEKAMNMLGS